MAKTHLTDIVVQRLSQPGTYYDATTPAFGIRVGKHRKTWLVIRGKERLRTSLGHYPAVSLAEARKEAKKLLTEAPLDRKARTTFSTAYDEYKGFLEGKKPKVRAEYQRLIGKYFIPVLGKKRLPELEYDEIIACVAKAAPSEAAHALAVCRAFLRWCVRPPRRYIPHSPLEGMQIKVSRKRKRVLDAKEVVTVWNAAAKQGYPHGTIVRLLILTGQRRGEIAGLRWPWINEKEQTITLPAEITKNGLEHTFPYNGQVAGIIETIPRLNSTDLLFPSRVSDERPISGWSKYKRELDELSQNRPENWDEKAPHPNVQGWTLHDLRRTFRTLHGEIGTNREIAERLINHAAGVTTEVEAIYDRFTYMPQMRAAIEKFDAHISTLLARR